MQNTNSVYCEIVLFVSCFHSLAVPVPGLGRGNGELFKSSLDPALGKHENPSCQSNLLEQEKNTRYLVLDLIPAWSVCLQGALRGTGALHFTCSMCQSSNSGLRLWNLTCRGDTAWKLFEKSSHRNTVTVQHIFVEKQTENPELRIWLCSYSFNSPQFKLL